MKCSVCNLAKYSETLNLDGSFTFKPRLKLSWAYQAENVIYLRCLTCYQKELIPIHIAEMINAPLRDLKEKYPFLGVDIGSEKSFSVTQEHKPKDE